METKNRDLKKQIEGERLKNKKRITMEPFAVEPEEWQAFREMAQPLENEHLELRVVLRDAEMALRADPDNDALKAKVAYLKKRLEELEKKAPWISSDAPWEILLWGGIWGC
ncbi:MAG: hypothetical protein ACREQA_06075 [Candidatus Binatia bacterium]